MKNRRMPLRRRIMLLNMAVLLIVGAILVTISIITASQTYGHITRAPADGQAALERDGSPQANQAGVFSVILLISAGGVILLAVGATYWMSAKSLKPVTDLSREIERIDENNLFLRVESASSNDEIATLSTSFNHMIGKLEKAFTAQKSFSANAAHELKTPLAAMISAIDVCRLDSKPTSREYEETLDEVYQNAIRLNDLVNNLLSMNEQSDLRREHFAARQMFEQIISELSNENTKQVSIDNQISDTDICGEKALIYRAFLNIVHNALKYNKPDGTVRISANEKNQYTFITVSDTGIGIPQDQLGEVFEPFYCVDKSRSRALGGSGLGLSVVKAIVDRHGGEIRVESELGAFTNVTVILPKR